MFSIFSRPRVSVQELVYTKLYDEKDFYNAFKNDLKHAQNEVIIESPYMTDKRSRELAPIFKTLSRRGVKIRVNTREPRHHDTTLRIQSFMAIKTLKQAGAKVYVCSDYRHRKLAIIDGEILWEGSLNIMSQCRSREIMRRTRSRQMCGQMTSFTGIRRTF